MLTKSNLNWQSIYVVLLGLIILCIGQDNSFLPFSFHGLFWRVMVMGALFVWFLAFKGESVWTRIWAHPLWWGWCALLLYQIAMSINSQTLGFSLNFIEGRLWISIALVLIVDGCSVPGAKVWFRRCIGACFVLGVLYGFYQVWIALPHLRENVAGAIDMNSEVHKQRFMLRLNSDEMFGSRLYSNLFGLFACAGLFCICPKVQDLKSPYRLGLSLIMLFALYASHSKGAVLVALCVAGLWVFVFLKERWRLSWFWLALPVVIGAGSLYALKDALQASVQIRLDYWKVAFEMLSNHPMGVGALNFSEYYGLYMHSEATEVKMAHNDHLQYFCEFGWLGGMLHFGFLAYLIYWVCSKKHEGDTVSKSDVESSIMLKGYGLFALYLIVTCVGGASGPWDLPLHGAPFVVLSILAVAWVSHQSKCFDSSSWVIWGILLMVLHAFMDMPFYDHGLLFLVLAAVFVDTKDEDIRFKPTLVVSILSLIAFVGVAFFAVQRYQHLLLSDILTMAKELKAEDVQTQTSSYTFDHQNFEPIYRKWVRDGKPKLEAGEEKLLEQLLKTKPMSSSLALTMGQELSPQPAAEAWLLKAYRHHPQQPRYAFHLGVFYHETGKLDEAKKYLTLALKRHEEAQELSKQNDDFLLHHLQSEQVRKAGELIQD